MRTKKSEIHGPKINLSSMVVMDRIKSNCELCDACGSMWSWMGPRNNVTGQYQIHVGGKVMNVRRCVLIAMGEKMFAGRGVQTNCVNPRCINPELTKQRTRSALCKGVKKSAAGAARISMGRAVIPMAVVEAIRIDPRPARAAAAEYGVSISSYENFKSGKRRKVYGNPWAGLMA